MKTQKPPVEWDHRAHQMAVYSLLREFDRVCRILEIPYVIFAGTLLGAVRHQDFIPWDDDLDVLMFREDYVRFLREADKVLDREKFFLQKEFSDHWPMFFSKLRLNGTACLEKFHPRDPETHQGVYMDIFPCDNALSSGLGRKMQFLCSKVVIAKSLDRRGYDTRSLGKKVFMGLCRLLPMKPFLAATKMGSKESSVVHSFLGAAHGYDKNVYPRMLFAKQCRIKFHDGDFPAPEDYDSLLRQLYGDYMRIPDPEEREVKQHALLVDLENSYEIYRHYRDDMEFTVLTRSIR
jgi:lipopolysaccharide cholinephosphotransferase